MRLPILALREDGIEIFVNARGEHHAPMFFVIGGKISATAGKTDSDRRSGNKHKALSVLTSAWLADVRVPLVGGRLLAVTC